jgi:uncharacterized protein
MASADDLFALYKLHLVDSTIAEIKKKAAAFDPTREARLAIEAFKPEWERVRGEALALHAEQTDLELQQKSIEEKIKKMDKELYGGKVVNPREVENIQKEIQHLKDKRATMDSGILEIWDQLPPAKARGEKVDQQMAVLRAAFEKKKQEALSAKAELEQDYTKKSAARAGLAKAVPIALLTQYEAIRKKMGGVGMALVNDGKSCSGCGTILPTKTLLMVSESKMVTCETCHRILFVLMPDA